jgi:ComF family protein
MCGDDVMRAGSLCGGCWGRITWIAGCVCQKCGYPFPADVGRVERCPRCIAEKGKKGLYKIRSACVYDDGSKKIVLPFKHSGKVRNGKTMANAMIRAVNDISPLRPDSSSPVSPSAGNDIDLVIPVPLSYWRLFSRGYNQASILAKPIARKLGAEFKSGLVARANRGNQGHKSVFERRRNISGVFRVKGDVNGRNILIVDDVITTGATLNELARMLLAAGAIRVSAVSFARAVKDI